MRAGLAYAICALLLLVGQTSETAAQTVLNANDRGWYNDSGSHSVYNKNTYTGAINADKYRSFFRFSIPADIGCISSATLELYLENYYGNGTSYKLSIYDVEPSHVPLLETDNGSGSGVAIHNDLGSGALYGSLSSVTSSQIGSTLSIPLSNQAIADISAAAGSDFAVGAYVTGSYSTYLFGLRFSAGGAESYANYRLRLELCTGDPNIIINKSSAVDSTAVSGNFAVPGSNITYTIEIANLGPGVPDADSLFLVDAMPPETVFFNGDVAGPGSGPVAISDNGSGLSFSAANDLAFSNSTAPPASFSACNYNPASGYDSNVKYVCLAPKGVLAAAANSSFSLSFRGRID